MAAGSPIFFCGPFRLSDCPSAAQQYPHGGIQHLGRGHRFITFRPLLFSPRAHESFFFFSFLSFSSLELLWCCAIICDDDSPRLGEEQTRPLFRLPPCMIIHVHSIHEYIPKRLENDVAAPPTEHVYRLWCASSPRWRKHVAERKRAAEILNTVAPAA